MNPSTSASDQTPLAGVSVAEALDAILANFAPLEPVRVPFTEALGLTLAEDVLSDMDIPPFDNSSMDGYALRAADVEGARPDAPVGLTITGYLPAGGALGPDDRVEPGCAFRVMTGAPIPPGADAVVPFELTSEGRTLDAPRLQPQQARARQVNIGDEALVYRAVKHGDNVREAGTDMKKGQVALRAGTTVRPAEVGVLASVGKTVVPVHRRPRVAVLATGDELVDPDRVPGPGQIRNTNNYTIAAQAASWGAQVFNLGVAHDNREHLLSRLHEALSLQPDLLVTSAGVSVGDYDIVKEVLMEMGTISMWRVRLRPGKPIAFGRLRAGDVPLLGLPGNPVSSMVTMELFGRPAIMKMLGRQRLSRPSVVARLLEPIENRSGRESYIRGVVTQQGDEYVARTTGDQSSHILTSMSKATALLVVSEDTTLLQPGDKVHALILEDA